MIGMGGWTGQKYEPPPPAPKPPPPPPPRWGISIIACPPGSECGRCWGDPRYFAQSRVVLTRDGVPKVMDMCSRCLGEWIETWPFMDFAACYPAGVYPAGHPIHEEVTR